jgi:hypothetical protein
MSSRTYTEEEVQDLTDLVFLLKEQLEAGKMRFANQELADGFRRSYEAIRLRPDGKVDPTSLDGRIRASTLALIAMKQREDAKRSLSLAQVQEAYFAFLFREFGWLYDQMKRAQVTPTAAAEVSQQWRSSYGPRFLISPDFSFPEIFCAFPKVIPLPLS